MNETKFTNFSISNGTFVRAILFGLLVVAIFTLRDLLLVLLTAIVMASFVTKVSSLLFRKYKINRTFSVVFIYFLALAILSSVVYLFLPILISELSNLLTLIPDSKVFKTDTIIALKEFLKNFSDSYSVSDIVSGTKTILARTSQGLLSTLSAFFGGIVNFVLIIVLSFYFSIQEKSIENFLRIVTPLPYEEYVISLWERSQRKIALWVRGQLLLGLLVGIFIYIGLSILGFEYALIIAIASAMFELIPFGLILAAIPAVSFAFAQGGVSFALLIAGFYFVVQQLENYIISPLLVNKVVGISPLVVILAILTGSILAGFWGVILAIPVAVVLLEFTTDLEKKKITEKS